MGKDKLEDLIRRETLGPSLGEIVTGTAIIGILEGVAKAVGCIFNTKR